MISDDELLAYVNPATDDDLTTLRRLERAAVAHVQSVTGSYFGVEDEIVETIRRYGPVIHLANTPADGVELESWDGSAWTAVAADQFTLTGSTIEFASPSGWNHITGPTRYRATYDAGYATVDVEATDAPEDVRQAVLLLVGHWFENREAVVVGSSSTGALDMAVTALLAPHTRLSV